MCGGYLSVVPFCAFIDARGKPNSHASFILQAHFDEGAVVIYYGVPRKSAAIVWQKDLFRFLPVGQGDIKCPHVYSSHRFWFGDKLRIG